MHVGEHEMMPIEDDLAPERYEIERCPILNHSNHILDEICRHCMKLFCKRCHKKQACPALTGKPDEAGNTVSGECRVKANPPDHSW